MLPALALLYAITLALTILLLLLFFAFPAHATRLTANLAIAELIMLGCQTIILAAVFLLT